MTAADRTIWDARFAAREGEPGPPDPYLARHVDWLRTGAVLDLACGDGRNALFLATARPGDLRVCGVDISPVGLARLQGLARARDLTVTTYERDLDDARALADIGPWDAIVVLRYKPAPALWPAIASALRPGGRLLLSTFNLAHHERRGFPRRFCLAPRELVAIDPRLTLIEHTTMSTPESDCDGYRFERGD